jgi:CopG family nickel-responsive transcriptional regulator
MVWAAISERKGALTITVRNATIPENRNTKSKEMSMPAIARFGVSFDKELLAKFDGHIKSRNYATRSKAIEDLVRQVLVDEAWLDNNREVAGTVTAVYNHHKRELVNHLLNVQHDCQTLIISSQHIHLDHDNCLEVIVVRGKARDARRFFDRIRTAKGVGHAAFTMAAND